MYFWKIRWKQNLFFPLRQDNAVKPVSPKDACVFLAEWSDMTADGRRAVGFRGRGGAEGRGGSPYRAVSAEENGTEEQWGADTGIHFPGWYYWIAPADFR